MSEADSSVQVELDSGKRVKVKAANVLLRFDKPAPAELMAQASALAAEIDLDLAWEFAPDEDSALPTWRATISTPSADAGPAGRRAAAPVRCAALLPPPAARACSARRRKRPSRPALLGIERKKQLAAQIEAWAAELVAGPLPGAGARAALPHPLQARQERARVQGRGRGRQAFAARAARPAEGSRRDRQPLPVPLAALPVRAVSPRARASRPAGGARDQGRPAAARRCRPSRSTTRPPPRSTTRCRCTGLGTGTVMFGIHIAAPGAGHRARLADRPGGARARCPPSTCPAAS